MKQVLLKLQYEEIQIIYVTGKKHYNEFVKDYIFNKNIKIESYVNQTALMSEISLLVTRGGATTAAEIAVFACPSIIIPSPYVPNNHQYYNALALRDHQACLLIEEKDLMIDSFCKTIIDTIRNKDLLKQMSLNAKQLAMPNAASDMVKWIKRRTYD